MTKVRIRWLIGLLSVALMGLIAFQFYWISEVISVNKERFEQSVNNALNEVTTKLAMKNDIKFLEQDINSIMPIRQNNYQTRNDVASLGTDSIKTVTTEDHIQEPVIGNSEEFFTSFFQVQFDEKTGMMDIFIDYEQFSRSVQGYQPNNAQLERYEMERQMNNRMNMLKRSWATHLAGSNNLFQRVNPVVLDTLIAEELEHHGLDIEYHYGIVYEPSQKVVLANSTEDDVKQVISKSPLKVDLFPMDLVEKGFSLSIDFPGEKNYLLSQALIPLSASGILLLVIIGCFSYAVMVILRQKKISEVKNDFINNMTHEFKTPIATVSLATEALQDNDIRSSKSIVDRYVQVIREENKRLGMQVEKVLQIASLDKKDFKLKIEETNLNEVIDGALVNINILVEKREGTITSQLLASQPIIEGDTLHLTNIIYNLLDNANKYSPDAPEIHIRTENISSGVIVKISDKGIGMSKEATQKIFDKFYRVSTGNVHDVKGFGLGLSYVKNIVDMHHGSISVKSALGQGSTFKIYLPFKHGKL